MVRVLFTAKQLLEAVLGNVEGVVVVDSQLQVPLDHPPYLFFAFRPEHRRVPFCSPAKSLLFHNPGSSGYITNINTNITNLATMMLEAPESLQNCFSPS